MGFFEQWTTILPKKGILRIPHHGIFQQIYAGTIRKKLHAASLTFLLDSRSPSGRENITISRTCPAVAVLSCDLQGNAYMKAPMKYYYSDLGLRNTRLKFRQEEGTHNMENIIYNELRHRKFNVDIGQVSVNEKNASGTYSRKQIEVDFVANKGSKRYYIQSAYMIPDEAKRKQEIRSLLKIGDSFKKIVITSHAPPPLYDDHGILTMIIYDFLLNPDSLEL